jgi:glutamate-1-semialdehyde 2,1-aminomutase
VSRAASLLTVFFTPDAPVNWETASKADTARFGRFFHELLNRGVYWPPSQYEAAFISLAHNSADIETTIRAIEQALPSAIG